MLHELHSQALLFLFDYWRKLQKESQLHKTPGKGMEFAKRQQALQ